MGVSGYNLTITADKTAVWADSAAANTEVNLDYSLPSTWQEDALYLIVVYNPSAVTALTVKARVTADNFGGATRYAELTSFGVPINSTKAVLVQGWLLCDGGRLTLSNDTVLGAADGFTANVRVRQV